MKEKTHTKMNIPQHVEQIKIEGDLALYNYTDAAIHPSDASQWKGIVVDRDTGHVVAKSFQWSATDVVEPSDLPTDTMYTRFMEATVLRFYKHNGQCKVSTHSQINITDKKSRVGTGRPFMELISEAVSDWKYMFIQPTNQYAFEPFTWQDLCVDGWVHVFLLVDQSNQITDLEDLTETLEVVDADGNLQAETFASPRLLHALSYRDDNGELVPYIGPIQLNQKDDDTLPIIPEVERLSYEQAQGVIANGGAVVGYYADAPDATTKFHSKLYARKLELAGETFNPVHRWHELMDRDPALAAEYLTYLPWHKKDISSVDMRNTYMRYLEESTNYLSNIITRRVRGERVDVPHNIYELPLIDNYRVPNLITDLTRDFQQIHPRNKLPSMQQLNSEVAVEVVEFLQSVSYTRQHTLHGRILKAQAGFI